MLVFIHGSLGIAKPRLINVAYGDTLLKSLVVITAGILTTLELNGKYQTSLF